MPAEAWADVDPFGTKHKDECWFEGWDGLLAYRRLLEELTADPRREHTKPIAAR
jgi:hypothetical protein